METNNLSSSSSERADVNDREFFTKLKAGIEKHLAEMNKVVDGISQMRVEAAYLESDLMSTIDATTWTEISELIGIAAMNSMQMTMKKE